MSDSLSLIADITELPSDREKLIKSFVDGIMNDIIAGGRLNRGTVSFDSVREKIDDMITKIVDETLKAWNIHPYLDAIVIAARESAKMTKEQRFARGTDVLAFMERDNRFDKYSMSEKVDIIQVSHIPMQLSIDASGNDVGDD